MQTNLGGLKVAILVVSHTKGWDQMVGVARNSPSEILEGTYEKPAPASSVSKSQPRRVAEG